MKHIYGANICFAKNYQYEIGYKIKQGQTSKIEKKLFISTFEINFLA